MIQKTAFLAVLCVTLATLVISTSPLFYSGPNYLQSGNRYYDSSHNLTVGYRQYGDRLVYREYIFKAARPRDTVSMLKSYNGTKALRITQVQALDGKRDGTGAYPLLVKGGPGYSNVTLRFTSQVGKPVNFTFQVFGKYVPYSG